MIDANESDTNTALAVQIGHRCGRFDRTLLAMIVVSLTEFRRQIARMGENQTDVIWGWEVKGK